MIFSYTAVYFSKNNHWGNGSLLWSPVYGHNFIGQEVSIILWKFSWILMIVPSDKASVAWSFVLLVWVTLYLCLGKFWNLSFKLAKFFSEIFTNSQYLHDIDSSEQDHKYHALIWYSLVDNFQKYFWIFLTKQIKGIFDCQFHKSDSSPLFWTKLIFYNLSHIFKEWNMGNIIFFRKRDDCSMNICVNFFCFLHSFIMLKNICSWFTMNFPQMWKYSFVGRDFISFPAKLLNLSLLFFNTSKTCIEMGFSVS